MLNMMETVQLLHTTNQRGQLGMDFSMQSFLLKLREKRNPPRDCSSNQAFSCSTENTEPLPVGTKLGLMLSGFAPQLVRTCTDNWAPLLMGGICLGWSVFLPQGL